MSGAGQEPGCLAWLQLPRPAVMGLAAVCDITFNYPLWIVAKRTGAGLPLPRSVTETYKGGGLLWFSLFPTTAVEDGMTTLGAQSLGGAVSAAVSGGVAAVCVTSQVETLITRAHAMDGSLKGAFDKTWADAGLRGLLLPYGMAAMVGREVPFALGLFFSSRRLHEKSGGSFSFTAARRWHLDYHG
mmetsp:Transcript_106587/g.244043  ORF Transcript_106587/g.244043 Transcript_106587/m.244043 type:complete len:186 (-) Transcript_106587:187-744(-)